MQDYDIKLIINRLIEGVQCNGISDTALLKACVELDLKNSFCKFQNGIYSALEYMEKDLIHSVEIDLQNFDLENMAVRERVKLAMKLHLANYAKLPNYREFLKNLFLFAMLPKNTYFSNKLLYRIVSSIWYAIYDQSTDFNYYTKRVILAGVYLSTTFFFINDYSDDFTDTLLFLDKRIDNVMTFQQIKSYVMKNIFKV
ncbi:TetR family transcriptional regulator [Wolbachia pipientis]|uniref:TetR family transcriptional regulator n=1 Tax=Wolbachia pipientis TaxID=955 RepID=A0A1E7QK10_WOLPI|nr:COQ9 family protein [Wolbachia pipientis]OEY86554.1 TetR family transcriptional regulator [Wolbachia pipientis]